MMLDVFFQEIKEFFTTKIFKKKLKKFREISKTL
jgi:hypothetical protein